MRRSLLASGRSHFLEGVAMIAEFLVLLVLPALLAAAAGWDLASFTIPNFVPLALIAGFVAFVVVAGMTPGAVGFHVLAGFVGLAIGFTLFALGYVGGGDAKLFAVVVLWLGFGDLPNFALLAAILGGALALALMGLRTLPLPAVLVGQSWIRRLHDTGSGIPYGVALAAGALLVLPHTEVFRLAVG